MRVSQRSLKSASLFDALFFLLSWLTSSLASSEVTRVDGSFCSCGFLDPSTSSFFTDASITYFNETGTVPIPGYNALSYNHTRELGWNTIYRQGATLENVRPNGTTGLDMFIDRSTDLHLVIGSALQTERRDIRHGTFRASLKSPERSDSAGGSAISFVLRYNETQSIELMLANTNNISNAWAATLVNSEFPDRSLGVNFSDLEANASQIGIRSPWDYTPYRIDWNSSSIGFFIGTNNTRTVLKRDQPDLISLPVPVLMKHWSTGDKYSMEGPPRMRSAGGIEWMRFFFNSTTTSDRSFDACNPDARCSVEDLSLRGSSPYNASALEEYEQPVTPYPFRIPAIAIAAICLTVSGLVLLHALLAIRKPWRVLKKGLKLRATDSSQSNSSSATAVEGKRSSAPSTSSKIRVLWKRLRGDQSIAGLERDSCQKLTSRKVPSRQDIIETDGNRMNEPSTNEPLHFDFQFPRKDQKTSESGQKETMTKGEVPEHAPDADPWVQDAVHAPKWSPSIETLRNPEQHLRRVQHSREKDADDDLTIEPVLDSSANTLRGEPSFATLRSHYPSNQSLRVQALRNASGRLTAPPSYETLRSPRPWDRSETLTLVGDQRSLRTQPSNQSMNSHKRRGVPPVPALPEWLNVPEPQTDGKDVYSAHKAEPGVSRTDPDRKGVGSKAAPEDAQATLAPPATLPSFSQPANALGAKRKRVDYLAGIVAFCSLIVTVQHFCLSFVPASIIPGPEIIHHQSEVFVSRYVSPVLLSQLWLGLFFTTSCRFMVDRYLQGGDLRTIAAIAVRRIPRFMIPVTAIVLIEYFAIDAGATKYLQYTPSITWSQWPYVERFPSFGIFLSELLQLLYLIPNGFPQITFHYCTGVLWTVTVQLQSTWLILLGILMIREMRTPWKRMLFYAFVIVVNWYAVNWGSYFYVGILLTDLDLTYKYRKWLYARGWAYYPLMIVCTLMGLGALLSNVLAGVPGATPEWNFSVVEDGWHPDVLTGRPIVQTPRYAYPEYYVPRLNGLIFATAVQTVLEISHFVQRVFSAKILQLIFPHIFTIYLIHGLIFWSWGAWLICILADRGFSYSLTLSIAGLTSYAIIGLSLPILTPITDVLGQDLTVHWWAIASEKQPAKRPTLHPYNIDLFAEDAEHELDAALQREFIMNTFSKAGNATPAARSTDKDTMASAASLSDALMKVEAEQNDSGIARKHGTEDNALDAKNVKVAGRQSKDVNRIVTQV